MRLPGCVEPVRMLFRQMVGWWNDHVFLFGSGLCKPALTHSIGVSRHKQRNMQDACFKHKSGDMHTPSIGPLLELRLFALSELDNREGEWGWRFGQPYWQACLSLVKGGGLP